MAESISRFCSRSSSRLNAFFRVFPYVLSFIPQRWHSRLIYVTIYLPNHMLFWPIFGNFWCLVVTLVTFGSNLSNFERYPKKPKKIQKNRKKLIKIFLFLNPKKKSKKKIKNIQKIQKSIKNPKILKLSSMVKHPKIW